MKLILMFFLVLTSLSAKAGSVDLKGFHWDESSFEIRDSWQFYWKEFLTPDSDISKYPFVSAGVGAWNRLKDSDSKSLDAFGYATYRIELNSLIQNREYSFYLASVSNNARVFIYPQKAPSLAVTTSIGRPSKSESDFIKKPLTLSFNSFGFEDFVILIQVSNHTIHEGGLWVAPRLGFSSRIRDELTFDNLIVLVALGITLTVGVYALLAWLIRRSDYTPLFLFFLALASGLRTIATSPSIAALFGDSWGSMLYRLEYASIPMSFAYFLFLKNLFKLSSIKYYQPLVGSYALGLIVLAFSLNLATMSSMLVWFQLSALANGLGFIHLTYKAFSRKQAGVRSVVLGVFLILITVAYDTFFISILHLDELFLTPVAVALFLVLLSHILIVRIISFWKRFRELAESKRRNQELLRQEIATRMHLASELAHRVNNPLNYIRTALDNASIEVSQLKDKVFALFEGQGDQEVLSLKASLEEDFSRLDQSISLIEKGSNTASSSIEELRTLSGVDGRKLEFLSLEKILKESSWLKELSALDSIDSELKVFGNGVVFKEIFRRLEENLATPSAIQIYSREVNLILELIVTASSGLSPVIKQINYLIKPYRAHIELDRRASKIYLNFLQKLS